ncbi:MULTISPECIES: hypothetical protein [unclassified Pseudomonas]|uniref:hypothetical protein n=1 Tax=unclassified Pseudomonas TaxID=196821 RepID=UPI002AC99E2F|nr:MULTISPECIES: hypothetical protein [unclassified Pseudomonas]MEB0041486.1 hypothetical protein [Pseudomonas sp. MH10]MEB0121905.1 hypothetical protein [Pseudomonas sp. CCI1.2]WPX64425.1 hypothetical protein RHM59_01640 [Pseudomonas sp. MH10]
MQDYSFDTKLKCIPHFTLYPNLKPWVGSGYRSAPAKILVLGESHYLEPNSTYHHNPQSWYSGIDLTDVVDQGWINTRGIIHNGIGNHWKGASKTIYRNIASALEVGGVMPENSFMSIAFMNYFQRPAEQAGESIWVSPLDLASSAATVGAVVRVIKPDLVVFCSSLAWKSAKKTTLLDEIRGQGLQVRASSHPSSAWWNRPSKRLKGRTGKEAFMAAVAEVIKL